VRSHVEGAYFKCWYYNPSYVTSRLNFDLVSIEGLCTIVPPSYMHNFAQKHPALFKYLTGKEDKLKSSWPWKLVGDYYILTMRKP
jgi:hypothetical protein